MNNRHRLLHRRGAVLFAVIVCVMIAAAIFVSIIRTAAACRRASQRQLQQAQAAWLAESALERAAAALAGDAQYGGETWNVPADQLTGEYPAVVLIEVEPVPGRGDRRRVRARADYPDHPHHRCREVRQVQVQLR